MLNKDLAISVNNISKKYYKNKGLFFKNKNAEEDFFALKNVSFEVHKGQILGIIGPNGAGKSTLLKILSDVVPPSAGYIEYEGSILSILEVGTGFHPDLSGYENIFLNASILGMKKSEITEKASQIIEFSGVGEVIHEPVKHYSSGMYLRLALSIALFTNNEILLLDEVISVGDVEFRYKAIKKIKELAQEGRTCIMISHDLGSIVSICNYCIFLEKGEIVFAGKPKAAVEDYLDGVNIKFSTTRKLILEHPKCKFIALEMQKTKFYMDDAIEIKIKFEKKIEEDIDVVLHVRNYSDFIMTDCEIYRPAYTDKMLVPGVYETVCTIPANLFNAGTYFIDILLGDKISSLIHIESAGKFVVQLREWEWEKKWNKANESIPFRPVCAWETVAAK